MSTGDVLTKHTLDAATRPDLVEVKVPVLSANGTNDTYVTKLCIQGLASFDDNMDVDSLDFLVHVPFMLIMIIGGLFGNTLIIWVLWRQEKRTLTGGLFVMVALTDNFVLLFYLLHFTLPTLYEYTQAFEDYYIFYATVKIYIWFGYVASRTMSIYAVVLLVVNRYLSVACAKRTLAHLHDIRYVKLGVALVIALSILVNFPQILLFESNPFFDPCTAVWMPKIEKAGLLHKKSFVVAYQLFFHVIGLYVFPVLVLAFCLIKLMPYMKRSPPQPTSVEEPLHEQVDRGSGSDKISEDRLMVGFRSSRTGQVRVPSTSENSSAELEMKEIDHNHADEQNGGGGTSGLNRETSADDFSDGDVEAPAIVNERIVAVIYAFMLMHTTAILLHVSIMSARLSGSRLGTGNKTSMVLSEFHELLLGSFCAIKFYLYIFIGKRYWHALEKTVKLCSNIHKGCKPAAQGTSSKENNNRCNNR